MENEKETSTEKGHCKSGHCHSTKFILGLLSGVAASFILGFAFIALFAGGLIKSDPSALKGADPSNIPQGAPAAQVNIDDLLEGAAKEAGLDAKKLASCVEKGTFKDAVEEEMINGQEAGVQGTPNNIIISKSGTSQIPGALPLADFKEIVDSHIAGTVTDTVDIELPAITKDDWIKGAANAPVTIVEYSDIDCPFCKRHHPTLDQIVEDYDGQVNWVYRHFPLDQLHPYARTKAEASECAGDLGGNDKFWEFLDILYLQ